MTGTSATGTTPQPAGGLPPWQAAGLTRRHLLAGAGLGAGALALAACGGDGNGEGTTGPDKSDAKGSATSPLSAPGSLTEAPMLADQVKGGKLPKLEERLPENPYVVPHNWLERGKYGGTMKLQVAGSSGDQAAPIAEYFYGYSILRLLNDGNTIGPGVAEKWEANADTSVWTFHFRKGLKWSDGEPWSTADIMFWWNDLANNDDFGESVPDECKSGKGTPAKLEAVDELTLKVTFDAPTPLFPAKVASYVNGYKGNGASWMVPAHYVKNFHPKYNPSVKDDWATVGGDFEVNCDYKRQPKCPTLAGFHLTSLQEGKSLQWERNPYYYAVSKDGDQLPYVDKLLMSVVQDPKVSKVQVSNGQVDYVHGPFIGLALADVQTLQGLAEKNHYRVLLWDTGTGTGSMMFANLDYKEANYRELFNEPTFRQALSHAFNREETRSSIYFKQGEVTTGTISPKGVEFVGSAEGKKYYEDWKSSFVAYDVDKAKGLLDELGLKDKDGDGMREFPDGKKLSLRIDLPADAGDETKAKDAQLCRDWGKVGLKCVVNPVTPTGFDDGWANGSYMLHSNWEVSGPPNSLLTNPSWLVPIEVSRWAPLQGTMYSMRGTPDENTEADVDPWKRKPPRRSPEDDSPIKQLWDLLDQTKVEPDELKRNKAFYEIIKIHIEKGPFFQGTVSNVPAVIVANLDLRNLPTRDNLALNGMTNPWGHPNPAVYDPEVYFWTNPDQHTI